MYINDALIYIYIYRWRYLARRVLDNIKRASTPPWRQEPGRNRKKRFRNRKRAFVTRKLPKQKKNNFETGNEFL
jgi:hypothetical protein